MEFSKLSTIPVSLKIFEGLKSDKNINTKSYNNLLKQFILFIRTLL